MEVLLQLVEELCHHQVNHNHMLEVLQLEVQAKCHHQGNLIHMVVLQLAVERCLHLANHNLMLVARQLVAVPAICHHLVNQCLINHKMVAICLHQVIQMPTYHLHNKQLSL